MPARDAALREVVAEMQSHPDFMVKAYAKRLEALLAAPSEAGAHGWQQDRRGGQLDTPAVPEPGAVPKMPKAVLDAMSAYRDALADCAAEGHSWFASNAADDAHSAWWDATIAALAAAHAAGRREREGEIVKEIVKRRENPLSPPVALAATPPHLAYTDALGELREWIEGGQGARTVQKEVRDAAAEVR